MSWREKLTDPLIKFCKKHPAIFFLEERIKRRNEIFIIIKIKTLYDETPKGMPKRNSKSLRAQISDYYDESRLNPKRKWMRTVKIDELPQIINLIRGDLQLIGLRPLPKGYLATFPNDVQKNYKKYKPGLIPGELQFNWRSRNERHAASRRYLEELESARNKNLFRLRSGIRAFFNSFTHPANG